MPKKHQNNFPNSRGDNLIMKDVEEYFMAQLGLKFSDMINQESRLHKPVIAFMILLPKRGEGVEYGIKIASRTKIKILGLPDNPRFRLKEHSHNLLFKVVGGQVDVGKLVIGMEKLVDAIKSNR